MAEDGDLQDSGWTDDELLETAHQSFGLGADESLPDTLRFLVGVTRVIRKRRQQDVEGTDALPAIFLLRPGAPKVSGTVEYQPMLDKGATPIGSRLWFVGPIAAAGNAIEIEEWTDQGAFQLAGEIGVDDVPAITFDPGADDDARFYPQGLKYPDCYRVVRLSAEDLTLDDVLEIVNRLHEESLVTPTAQPKGFKLWKHQKNHWPVSNAEELIQQSLHFGLTAALPSCTIRSELTGVPGRTDLEIDEPDGSRPGGFVRHALLELKVLRGFGSTGASVSQTQIDEWIEDGVKQAMTYRDDKGAKSCALCCFDMRPNHVGYACFAAVKDFAAKSEVTLATWHLFSTAKAYRSHIAV